MVDIKDSEISVGFETEAGISDTREKNRDNLSTIDKSTLANIYCFSHLPEYKDEKLISDIEDVMERKSVSERFDVAYDMVLFWDTYSPWKRAEDEQELAAFKELEEHIVPWLSDGLTNPPEDENKKNEIIEKTGYVVQRIDTRESFLSQSAKEMLEEAAGRNFSISDAPGIEDRVRGLKDKIE